MKKSALAILICITTLAMSVPAWAGDTGADRVVSLQPAAGYQTVSFKSDMKHMFKSIGHGFHRMGHSIHDFAKHTGRRVKAGVHAARHRR